MHSCARKLIKFASPHENLCLADYTECSTFIECINNQIPKALNSEENFSLSFIDETHCLMKTHCATGENEAKPTKENFPSLSHAVRLYLLEQQAEIRVWSKPRNSRSLLQH